jgi:endonuclease/exonuclease/phosphatase family metal-dependent hydrolase
VEATEIAGRGYLPGAAFGRYPRTSYIVWDAVRREVAASALVEPDGRLPDILCFQEVENIEASRIMNERYLGNHYAHSLLIDAYDPRNIDVGVLSTLPIINIRSHIDDVVGGGTMPFRSRDCLEISFELPDGEELTLFVNHLKSKLVIRGRNETDARYRRRVLESHQKRLRQATEIARYIDQRFRGQQNSALYAVVGDFNDTPESPWLAPLMNTPRLTNIISEFRDPTNRWTYYWRNRSRVSQIDYVLTSRALTQRIRQVVQRNARRRPYIERGGLGFRSWTADGETLPREVTLVNFEPDIATPARAGATPDERIEFRFDRYVEVINDWRHNISDHCPVKVWF